MNDSLIYDWNLESPAPKPPVVMLDDETLRDGLQSPSVRAPSIDQKLRILHLLDRIGVDTADIGLPGAGPHVVKDVERLAREIGDARLRIRANCAARTLIADVQPIADIVAAHRACRSSAAASSARARSAATRRTGPSITCSAAPKRPSASRCRAGPDRDVRHRRHDAVGSRHAAAAVHDRHPRGRVAHLHRRHRRARDAGGRARRRAVRAARHRRGRRARRRHRLARPPRSRHGDDQQRGRARGRRLARARHDPRHRRARRQHADGPADGQPRAHGLDSSAT